MEVETGNAQKKPKTEGAPPQQKGKEFTLELLKVFYTKLFPYDLMYKWLDYAHAPLTVKKEPGTDSTGDVIMGDADDENANRVSNRGSQRNRGVDKEDDFRGGPQLIQKGGGAMSGGGRAPRTFFARREFSLTIRIMEEKGEGEAYCRFRCYRDAHAWRDELIRQVPIKIDIGAVYNVPVSEKDALAGRFRPVEKEMIFDIDMTDYDDIRTCCSEANICHKCWLFMTVAVKVLNSFLREDFGFQNLMFIYSGRRGIHCWISDPRARHMANESRNQVADYLNVLSGGDNNAKRVELSSHRVHPVLRRAFDLLRNPSSSTSASSADSSSSSAEGDGLRTSLWGRLLHEQDFFGMGSDSDRRGNPELEEKKQKNRDAMINYLPAEMEKYVSEWIEGQKKRSGFNSVQLWETMEKWQPSDKKQKVPADRALKEIVLAWAYPRLDINVSKGMNHLLKSPFCVHPKTARVCIPIDPKKAESFDFSTVPTLGQLVRELEENGGKAEETSLASSVALLREFVKHSHIAASLDNKNARDHSDW